MPHENDSGVDPSDACRPPHDVAERVGIEGEERSRDPAVAAPTSPDAAGSSC
jgi:hypothetical protein